MASYFPLYPLTSHGINTTAEADGNDAFYMMQSEKWGHISQRTSYICLQGLGSWISGCGTKNQLLSLRQSIPPILRGGRESARYTQWYRNKTGDAPAASEASGIVPFFFSRLGMKTLTNKRCPHTLPHTQSSGNFAFGHFCRFVRLQTLTCACFEVQRSILIELSSVII